MHRYDHRGETDQPLSTPKNPNTRVIALLLIVFTLFACYVASKHGFLVNQVTSSTGVPTVHTNQTMIHFTIPDTTR